MAKKKVDTYRPQGPWTLIDDGTIAGKKVSKFDAAGHTKTARQDQHTEIVDLLLTRLLDTLVLLADVAVDDTSADIQTTGVVPAVGDIVCLKDVDGQAFYQGGILTVTPIAGNDYTVTLDADLDFGFTTADGCSLRSDDMAVDGSVTPVDFVLGPGGLSPEVEFDLIRFAGVINGTSAMDDGLFGDIAALTNGVLFRTQNGSTKNIFIAKTNGQLALRCAGDRTYESKAPAGQTSMSFRRSTNGDDKNGVTMRLTAAGNDVILARVKDDLTGLLVFNVNPQGHVVDLS